MGPDTIWATIKENREEEEENKEHEGKGCGAEG